MSKRVLLITYLFPPANAARSIRMSYIARYLSQWDWEVDVLTIISNSRYHHDENLLEVLPPNVGIYRTYSSPSDMMRYFFRREQRLPGSSSRSILNHVNRFIGGLEGRLLFPDAAVKWIPFAVNTGMQLIARNKYDLLFSSASPFSDHLVGYVLRELTNIPWVIENGDPFSYNPFRKQSGVKFALDRALEERILRKADGVILVTEETKHLYLEKFRHLHDDKIRVVLSGYDPDAYPRSVSCSNRKFTILYAGAIKGRIKPLVSFFEAIRQLSLTTNGFRENCEIILMGRIKKGEEKAIPASLAEQICVSDSVNFTEALCHMKRATVLLLAGNKGGIQIPSKTYQYIGDRRPMLVILGDEEDPLRGQLSSLNRAIMVGNDVEEILRALRTLYTLFIDEALDKSFDLHNTDQYTWKTSLTLLDRFLRKIVMKRNVSQKVSGHHAQI